MTVKQLITKLQKLPQDHIVKVECDYDCGEGMVEGKVIKVRIAQHWSTKQDYVLITGEED